MAKRIVLMFAYHFPPENAIGGVRPFYFYKYLSRMGYRCHVITAAEQGAVGQFDADCVLDPFLTSPREGLGWQVERAVRKFLIPAVTGFRWSRLAARAARTFLESNPGAEITIYSTYPPLGVHLAALLLLRGNKLKWIADFRDPLTDNPSHIGLTKFQQGIYRWLEGLILKRAAMVIANTDSAAEKLRQDFPNYSSRIHLIWNGYDPEDRVEQLPVPARERRQFTHTGELYDGRNITPLLQSIARLIESGQIRADSLRIRLVGPFKSNSVPDAEFLSRASGQGWLELVPEQVPREEARHIAQESDGLLLIQPHSTVQVPGKLFDYLRLGRPILAYILRGTPIERILGQSGVEFHCVYADSTAEEMDRSFLGFLERRQVASEANTWFRETFDAQKQAEHLGFLISSIHGR